MRGEPKHERVASIDVTYETVEEIDGDFNFAEPAFVLTYRCMEHPSAGEENRFVSCVHIEIINRFTRKIYGEKTEFIKANVPFMDDMRNELNRQITVPACFVFEDVPENSVARSVITSNLALFRNFAPVFEGNAEMHFLYERPIFRIRSENCERLSLALESSLTPMERFRRDYQMQLTTHQSLDSINKDIRDPVGSTRLTNNKKQSFSMEVDPCQTVGDLKKKIFESKGYRPEMQHLVFNGVALSDADRLADFEIREKCTLMLWLRSNDNMIHCLDQTFVE
eukprot:g6209.t1